MANAGGAAGLGKGVEVGLEAGAEGLGVGLVGDHGQEVVDVCDGVGDVCAGGGLIEGGCVDWGGGGEVALGEVVDGEVEFVLPVVGDVAEGGGGVGDGRGEV